MRALEVTDARGPDRRRRSVPTAEREAEEKSAESPVRVDGGVSRDSAGGDHVHDWLAAVRWTACARAHAAAIRADAAAPGARRVSGQSRHPVHGMPLAASLDRARRADPDEHG